ncbi:MAG: hypothetical protein HY529_06805 [Chloroflexi bacterium]|nr:hypothetical protein [Chloroflexota bacterium]
MSSEIFYAILLAGIALLAQYLPAKWGIPIGLAAVGLSVWQLGWGSWALWLAIALAGLVILRVLLHRGFLEKKANLIDDIKSDLVEINAYEKRIATEKSKKPYSKELALRVHKAFIATFGTDVNSFKKSLTQKVIGDKNVDPAIDVYEQMGNILDFVGHGLKKDLNDDKYTSWVKDVERKRLKIHCNKSKKEIVRKNINRIKVISYGLNSAIVVRSIIRHLPNNDNVAATRIGVYIEGLENEGAKILNQMLDQLDLEWKAIGDINLLQIMPK